MTNISECVKEVRKCHNGIFDGTFSNTECRVSAVPVTQFSLSHVSGHREFFVSTQSLNVVNSRCKVQFLKENSVWVDLMALVSGVGSEDFDCSRDLSNLEIRLPVTDYWTDHFSNLRVRLLKISGQSIVGEFPQRLGCLQRAFSEIPTPGIDENCNLQWDDMSQSAKLCKMGLANKDYGAPFTCPDKIVCEGMEAQFNTVAVANVSHLYKKDCIGVNFENGYSYGGGAQAMMSGNLPIPDASIHRSGCYKFNVGSPDDAANWVQFSSTAWSIADCEYLYDQKSLYY